MLTPPTEPQVKDHPLPMEDFQPEAPLTVSQWADRFRVLSELTSAEPGLWRTGRTPYLREIMDCFTDPYIEEIVIRAATQVGKTEAILNCLGYVIDYEPAPTMIVLPRDDDAKGWAAKRVKPMITSSPSLARHVTGREDDLAGKQYDFDRMFVKFAGANSPADLASDPCRYVFFDELDKYPPFSGREADPVKLGSERTRTFWNRKLIKVSTPTTDRGYITREYERSDKRRLFVPCPHCGVYQPLVFRKEEGPGRGEFKWPEGANWEEIEINHLAWYECGYCERRIDELQKDDMNPRGVWCPDGAAVSRDGKLEGEPGSKLVRGYHLPAFYSPWVSWSKIVSEFLQAKDDASKLMAWVNSVAAEPWKERARETKESHLKRLILPHPMGFVPAGALVLTGGVDVQQDHFWFVIRGWGIGEESWLIRYGRVETFADLDLALGTMHYPSANRGNQLVRLINIDSAGNRTNEVYHWCMERRDRWRPTKGYDHILATPYRVTTLEKDTRGRTIPGGLGLWTLDTNYYKDKLNRLIHTPPGSPAEWHLCEGVEQQYFDQLTSEHKIVERNKTTGRITESWQPVSEKRANHLLDCEVLAVLAADMLKVYLLRDENKPTVFQPREQGGWLQRETGEERPRGSGWLNRS